MQSKYIPSNGGEGALKKDVYKRQVLGIPCVLGMTDWSSFAIGGKNIMDLEDFLVSNNLLPLGSMVYLPVSYTHLDVYKRQKYS